MFDHFKQLKLQVKQTSINLLTGGKGEPVLLLHGYAQAHVCWHLVAPLLAEKFTIICSDLRGCGDSSRPQSDAEHPAYSKRTMANDQVSAMAQLGFDRFAVVGHDRGARVAHRMALDHSEKVSILAMLDIIPTSIAFANVNKAIATNAFNWFFPYKTMICRNV